MCPAWKNQTIRSSCTPNFINGAQRESTQNLLTARGSKTLPLHDSGETGDGGVPCLDTGKGKRTPGFLQLLWERGRQLGAALPCPAPPVPAACTTAAATGKPLRGGGDNPWAPAVGARLCGAGGPGGSPSPLPQQRQVPEACRAGAAPGDVGAAGGREKGPGLSCGG